MSFELGLEKRERVLKVSLLIENMSSAFLSRLMGIENYRETISFGNKSTSLSFNQKINLLIDIGALPYEQRVKFITFMEIRNQFMHNLEANTYKSCFSFIPGKDTFLLKMYPQDADLDAEEQLERASTALGEEIGGIMVNLIEKIKNKIEKETKYDVWEKLVPILAETIEKLSEKK